MKLKRFIAYLVDILLVGVIATSLSSVTSFNPYYDNYIESYDAFNETIEKIDKSNISEIIISDIFINQLANTIKYSLYTTIISTICYLLYFVGFQKWNKNQTIGKKLMKIKVVTKDNKDIVSVGQYAIRTIFAYNLLFNSLCLITTFYLTEQTFLIALLIISGLGYIITYTGYLMILFRKDGRGLHDLLGSTKVVVVEDVSIKS